MSRLGRVVVLVLACVGTGAWGQAESPDAAERERIRRERAGLRAELAREEAACQQRFLVQRCLDRARRDHRERMADLDRQQHLLESQERLLRGAERLERIQSKSSEGAEARAEAARERARESQARLAEARQRLARQGGSVPPGKEGRSDAAPPQPKQPRAQHDAQAERERHAAKQARARERQEKARQRQAAREASGRAPSRPLPVPAADDR